MRTPLALLAPTLLALLVTLPTPATAQPPAPAKPTALAAVPTDSFAFLTVNVGKLYDAPGFKPLRDWFAAQKVGPTDTAFGLPASDIERVTAFAANWDPDDGGAPLILVTTRQQYNEAKVLKALGAEDDELGRGRGRSGVTHGIFGRVVFIDDRTILFLAREEAGDKKIGVHVLAQLIARKPDGPLAAALADAAKHDIAFAMNVRQLDNLVREEGLARKGPFVPYLSLLKARTLTFVADFDKTARGSLKLTFADEATAKRAAPVLKEGLADLAAMFEKEAGRAKEKDSLEWQFLETATAVLKGAKVESEGANTFATAEMPYQDAVTKLAAALPKEYTAAVNSAKGQNNLKQLALAMHSFHDTMGVTPGDVLPGGAPNTPAWSWRVQILPYIEQENLYRQLDFTKSWDDPANLKKLEAMEMPKVFEIPGRPAPKGHTYFRIFTKPRNAKGTERPWQVEGQRGPRIAEITDGTSNTLMIVEAGEAVPWYKPDVLGYDGVLPLPQLGDKTADRFLAAMGDGSVRMLKPSKLGEKTLRALITIQGGEVITLP